MIIISPHDICTARNICTHAIFSTSSFNFGLLTYFVSHNCYGRVLYAVFYRLKSLLKKGSAQLFDCCVANNMPKVTHVNVHRVDTMFFVVLLVQFVLIHVKI